MFDSDEFDDDIFKGRVHSVSVPRGPSMDLLLWLAAGVVTSILLAIICRCCCRSNARGRVIAPPPSNDVPAPYPQQQYATPIYPGERTDQAQAVAVYPVGAGGYPTAAPYPTVTQYPTGAPYPTAAPYPTSAPYPTGAPYSHPQAAMQFPTPAPYPPAATAPDANACPPSYDQVMSSEQHKQPPYNPSAPH